MKFNKSSQLLLVSAASLLAAGLITACGTLNTDFVFVSSAKAAGPNSYGEIDVFEINAVSGFMRQIPTSPFPSGGRNPVAEAVSPDHANLYVVNRDDDTIVQFKIGSDGKLYPLNTVNTPGIFPVAVAVSGANLFVASTYQPLPTCSPADPCSGAIGVFPLLPSTGSGSNATYPGAPGTPVTNGNLNYWPLTLPSSPKDVILPTGINVLASGAVVYVSAYDTTTNAGYVFGFSVASSGALTPLNGGVPFAAGVHPSAIASATISTASYIYVTDSTNGNVLGYSVSSATATAGLLTTLPSVQYNPNPYQAGNKPSSIAVDPNSSYPYAYVANALDGSVSAYKISDGTLACNQVTIPAGAICRIGTYATGVQPVAIGIDPSTNHWVFTANYLGNGADGTVSDFELSTIAGTLINAQHSPYTANAQPTAVAAIPHKTTQ